MGPGSEVYLYHLKNEVLAFSMVESVIKELGATSYGRFQLDN